eukprot:scaffold5520_cov102-Isochrysis_galbana.AAC.8
MLRPTKVSGGGGGGGWDSNHCMSERVSPLLGSFYFDGILFLELILVTPGYSDIVFVGCSRPAMLTRSKKARRCPGSPELEPFEEPSATPSCGQLITPTGRSTTVNGTAEPRPGGSRSERCSERYSTLLRCGKVLYLFSRIELPRLAGDGDARGLHDDRWGTLVRTGTAGTASGSPGLLAQLSEPRSAMPAEWNMSSNAGFLCLDDGAVAVYGGRRKAWYLKHPYREAGILRSVGRPDGGGRLFWDAPRLVHSGVAGPTAPA